MVFSGSETVSYTHLIAIGNIHTTHIADLPVYNDNLPVIPVVHFAGEDRECYFQEGIYLNSGFLHFVEETVFYVPAAYVIV